MSADRIVISIIIPNFNGETYLPRCLRSLAEQSFKDFEAIVVDNASTDRSVELAVQAFPEVSVIRLDTNSGFAGAVNRGIGAARGEFVLILNNDTKADPDFVRALHVGLAGEPAAAMAAPKMLFLRDPRIVNSAGLGYGITGTNHDIGFGMLDGPDYEEPGWIFGPGGGAGIYRKDVFRRIGGFDEDFFMYYEDVDLSFRAQLAGYKCIYVPAARVYHAEGGSSASLPRSKDFFFARNSLWVIVKNYPMRLLLKYSAVILWEMLKRTLSPLRQGDASAFLGYCSAFVGLGRFLKKRREVQRNAKVPLAEIERLLCKNRSILKEINIHGRPCEGDL